MESKKIYRLELSEKQAEIIKIALEEYFRLRMGQFGDLAEDLAYSGYDRNNHTSDELNARNERRWSAEAVFKAALDVAQPMRKHGVYPEQTIEMLRAQDIWQVIRHRLWKDRHGDKNDWCVDAREPMPMTDEPLPKMERVEE